MKDLAVHIAEDRGVVEWTVVGDSMVYYANYPISRETYKVTVDLVTLQETRVKQSGYLKKGNRNIGL